MKRYKLLTETSQYPAGTLFTFEQKHKFMASLPWQMTRAILWETVEDFGYKTGKTEWKQGVGIVDTEGTARFVETKKTWN